MPPTPHFPGPQERTEVEARAVELEGDDAEHRRPTEALVQASPRPPDATEDNIRFKTRSIASGHIWRL